MSKLRTGARLCALPIAVAALTLGGAGAASAHVSVSPSEGAAGSFTVLTLSVPHGCDGSPTTKVVVQVPEQILSVTPTRNSNWDVKKVMTQLDEPVTDTHGNEVTERVGQVVYTAKTPLPEGYRDAFELSLQLPDAAGETLTFPAIQTCEKGETAWVEVPAEGQNPDELVAPAPTVTILPAEVEEDAATQTAAESDEAADESSAATEEAPAESGSGNGLAIAGLVAGLLGLVAGGAALVQVRRRA